MIVSHSRRFIFIKTRKVAGTSVELFLSQLCSQEDIITPLGVDEVLRPGMGARNFWKPAAAHVGRDDWTACPWL
jgi:hypothetical protein